MADKESKKGKKSKFPKSETTPYNPWAVCTESVGREDKEKYERCVQHIKDQNRETNRGKKSMNDIDRKVEAAIKGKIGKTAGVMTAWGPFNKLEGMKPELEQIAQELEKEIEAKIPEGGVLIPNTPEELEYRQARKVKEALNSLLWLL